MKKQITVTLGVMVILLCSSHGFAQSTIRLTNGEWEPYLSENLKHYGVVSHIVSEAFKLEGIKVEYGFFPWGRAMRLAKFGDFDGTLVWFHNPEREKDFYISVPVLEVKFVFFHLKSLPFTWETIDDLKGRTIGMLLPTKLSQAFEEAMKSGKLHVDRASTIEMNFSKLLLKRMDLFVTDIDVGNAILNRHFKPEEATSITYNSKPVHAKPMYLLLSKKIQKNGRMIQSFNRGLKQLKANGKYDQYFSESRQGKYINKPVKILTHTR